MNAAVLFGASWLLFWTVLALREYRDVLRERKRQKATCALHVTAWVHEDEQWFVFYEDGEEDRAVGVITRWATECGLPERPAGEMISAVWRGREEPVFTKKE